MNWFKSRFKEPSTWAGMAGLLPGIIAAAAAGPVGPLVYAQIAGGVLAVLLPEQKAK